MSLLEKLVTAAGISIPYPSTCGGNGNILDRFMTLGTCGPCVEIGDHVSLCMDFKFQSGRLSDVGEHSLVTWVPKNRVSVMMIALGNCCTAVYIVETKHIYYASDTISLPSDVPAGTILLANYTEDLKDNYREPRVLVYDVICWGAKPDSMDIGGYPGGMRYKYTNMQYVHADDRYTLLREDFGDMLEKEKLRNLLHAHPDTPPRSSTIILQWVGFASAASQFLHGGIQVGHEVSTLLQLSDSNALHPVLMDC
jgi:hypothetical protein